MVTASCLIPSWPEKLEMQRWPCGPAPTNQQGLRCQPGKMSWGCEGKIILRAQLQTALMSISLFADRLRRAAGPSLPCSSRCRTIR
jgi:hypothetical protein